ncbi:MAG: Nicotinate-nucleotide--dimethylbenzimidazole phosphoribosyltransferase [Syntrophorhabdus sp. PtaU1.Bin050]|nr:MAG: Nicotinate-nucleotide--dimethylbenzimidazole phosphoribosyltransferase [Syntrophorhabdus sp. PtaU1.Bin050]
MKTPLIEPVKTDLMEIAQQRLDSLTKPKGSLGRLEEFARRLVSMRGEKFPPLPGKKAIFTFAGDHGVVDEGVSLYPREVTAQMVYNFLNGGAGINVLARHAGSDVIVIDIGVDHDFAETPGLVTRKVLRGTRNMRKEPAMEKGDAERCITVGVDLAREYALRGYTLFGTGDMGIGNTTASSAITAVITGTSVSKVTGRGTGITDEGLAHKVRVIEESIALNKPDPRDPVDILAKVGGTEIGGIAGLILGAAAQRIPVVVDGFISTAGALIAWSMEPSVRDYIFAAHSSVEIGHKVMLDAMGLRPILDLDLRLGEGTGAALAMIMIEAGLKIYLEMATFDEAGVSTEVP